MARRSAHFRFESGHHGDRWLEPDLLLQRPTALRPFAIALAQRLQRGRERFEVVCGPLTGGAFLAQMVAEQCKVAFAFAERFAPPPSDALYQVRYRIPAALRDGLRGATVAIVNDVTNAGSAVRGIYEDLVACGARPVAFGRSLRSDGGRRVSLLSTISLWKRSSGWGTTSGLRKSVRCVSPRNPWKILPHRSNRAQRSATDRRRAQGGPCSMYSA